MIRNTKGRPTQELLQIMLIALPLP